MKYLFLSLIIVYLFLFVIPHTLAQDASEPPRAPETLKEAKSLGERFIKGFPKAFSDAWQEGLVVWRKVGDWFKNLWCSYISSWFKNIWFKINSFLERRVEEKKPDIKQGFEEEKQEMREEIPKTGKSLWDKLKELIK